jgi:hypothetical protein
MMLRVSLILFLLIGTPAFSDSPLTSTEFHTVYQHEMIDYVKKRVAAKGKVNGLNKKVLAFLTDKSESLEIKLAVINLLGWDVNGQHNAEKFMVYLKRKKKCKDVQQLMDQKAGDWMLCYAYLMAMDNYFDVTSARELSEKAVSLQPDSYATQLIHAMITAQGMMNTDWCGIYKVCDSVRRNDGLSRDLKKEASDVIFEYIDIYADNC